MRSSRSGSTGIVMTILALWTTSAQGDGGTLRAWKQQGDYDIAVFTEPSPVVIGPVDISVCLLDRSTGEMAQDAQIKVEIWPIDRPAEVTRQLATQQAATNKLLRAAIFKIRGAGRFKVNVRIDGPKDRAEIPFEVDVGNPWSPQTGIWPWILWPLGVILLYVIHRRLVSRSERASR